MFLYFSPGLAGIFDNSNTPPTFTLRHQHGLGDQLDSAPGPAIETIPHTVNGLLIDELVSFVVMTEFFHDYCAMVVVVIVVVVVVTVKPWTSPGGGFADSSLE